MNASQRAVSDTRVVDLDLDGMTCASCVNHVTKSLDALPGVRAEVNLATERARVTVASAVSDDELIAAVRGAGYQASVRGASASHASTEAHGHADSHSHHGAQLTRRLIVAAILSVPVLAVSMVPAWQFDAWQYVVFALSTPVVLWAGWPFHRAAWANLKQRTASMDTLVSVGTLVAYAWSVWALFFGGAGMIGMRHEWSLLPSSQAGATNGLYFEVAAVLTTVILLGRWLEVRSRRRAGAALNALAALLPDTARVLEQAAPDPGNLLAPTRRERVVPINEVQAGSRSCCCQVRPFRSTAAWPRAAAVLTSQPSPARVCRVRSCRAISSVLGAPCWMRVCCSPPSASVWRLGSPNSPNSSMLPSLRSQRHSG